MTRHGRPAPARAAAGGTIAGLLAEAIRHHRHGRLDQAAGLYRRLLKADPRCGDAQHLLGLVRHQLGDQAAAGAHIAKAIGTDPTNAAYHNSLGLVRLAEGDSGAAIAAFREALSRDPLLVEAFNNLGNALQKAGQLAEAVRSYDQALALRPEYPEALCNRGRALHGLDAPKPAEESLRAAVKLRPEYSKAHRFLGDVLAETGRRQDAEASFRRALAIAPGDAESLAALAALEERAGRLEAALANAERALEANPHDTRACVVAARCERRLGRPKEGLARLSALDRGGVEAEGRAHVAFERGAILDRLGAFDAAYEAYGEANRLAAQSPQARAVDRLAMPRLVETLRRTFTPNWLDSWSAPAAEDGPAPVFLIGFPRSGTTLLDQILDAHPRLQTLEEKPAVDVVRHAVAATPGGYPDALAGLDAEAIARLRRLYFDEVGRYLNLEGGAILVDKMPLNTIDVGLIVRLFPTARFLLALRHPCDVVLSNFMQAFKPNPAMVQFDSLAGAAAFHASVMDLWRHYETVLPLTVHRVRYEDLVTDIGGEIRRILDFLSLPWDDAVLDYAERAKTRAIATPSYHQVVQPVYARSVGRWRNYRGAFADVLPILRPSVEAFGYTFAS